jgi:hypothetical protein
MSYRDVDDNEVDGNGKALGKPLSTITTPELKPCPTCGNLPTRFSNTDAFRCEKCGKNSGFLSRKDWNTRPIEDSLGEELRVKQATIDKMWELFGNYCKAVADSIAREEEV